MGSGVERGSSRGLTIGRVASEEVDEAALILAEAFADEKMFTYILGGHREFRVRALCPYFRGAVRGFSEFGEVHSARLDGKLVGVGIRVPAGKWPPSARVQLGLLTRQLPGLLRMLWIAPQALRLFQLGRTLESGQPRGKPYWYLMQVGIHPDYRRRGIASRLAREVVDRADADGVGCYLETAGEGTVALYRKYGFEIIDEARPFPGGPVGWRLWREPSPSAAHGHPDPE